MKKYVIVLVFTLNFFSCWQAVVAQDSIVVTGQVCSYYGESFKTGVVAAVNDDPAQAIIESIINVIGLKPRFEIKQANIPNAAAVIYNNKRLVIYNPNFVAQLTKATGSKWAATSILAHEIGHHLNGHTLEEGGSRPDIELEADEFSGFVLNKLGATLEQAQAAMKIAASQKSSHTHPGKADRLAAIASGWNNASGKNSPAVKGPGGPDIEVPVATKSEQKSQSVIDEKYISKTIFFSADPEGKYFVTIRNNVVKIKDGNLYVIGRLGESNKKGYSKMLYDQHYNYLYISSNGDIVNGSAKRVGHLKKFEKG